MYKIYGARGFRLVNSRPYMRVCKDETLLFAWQPDDLQKLDACPFGVEEEAGRTRVDSVAAHWADWKAGAHATGIHQGPKRQRTLSSNGDSTKSSKAWRKDRERDVDEKRKGEMNGPWDHS